MTEEEKEILVEETDKNPEDKSKKKKKNKIEEQLETIQDELTEVKDKYFRALAEMENYKKRMTEDLKRERKYAALSLADKLIDSVEVFDQALNMETEDKNLKNFLYGFKMINDMIFNALKDEGLMVIESKIGDDFDPTIHEAMDVEYNPEVEENKILKIYKKGYKFKDRVLRPTMVIINQQPYEKEEQQNLEEENNINENIEE